MKCLSGLCAKRGWDGQCEIYTGDKNCVARECSDFIDHPTLMKKRALRRNLFRKIDGQNDPFIQYAQKR